ncbi:MAG: bifunctional 4-hydroxy-2-oxoglutarate aldolase/2-dehydro-3-deoxy-phosphogluconate aldolase [Anaerolineales bacterium]|nr:bifunctional 4-hydroxy-2-oxoglutarate aldolase/2-dehydro-3-deoxy-phosphogluconate aldolase [Anaerolineales bacterium]
MAQYRRLEVYNVMLDLGLIPLFYHGDFEVSKQVVMALHTGGGRVIEFTNRGDFAVHVFTELNRYVSKALPEVILGVGSVLDAPTAAMYIAAGANFVVGPMLNPEVARICNRRMIPYLPGCGTVSEISNAHELGVEIIKLFPGESVGGPGFVKAILGPLPWARVMPTGGVDATEESIKGWFKAGVCAVGMGSNLVTRDYVAAGNYAAIADRTAQVLSWIRQARGKKST